MAIGNEQRMGNRKAPRGKALDGVSGKAGRATYALPGRFGLTQSYLAKTSIFATPKFSLTRETFNKRADSNRHHRGRVSLF
jgi:hypothetical protein